MLSFSTVCEKNIDEFLRANGSCVNDGEFLSEVARSLASLGEEVEVALSTRSGVLFARIFDEGRYSFVYPINIDAEADMDEALFELVAYTRRELVPIYLTDVPRDEVDRLTRLFTSVTARAYLEDEDSFMAIVNSECDVLDEVPTLTVGEITLSPLTRLDEADYTALLNDEEVGRYWGFSDAEDNSTSGVDYITVAESEFMRGVALSLAVRYEGRFIGEAVLFDFDYRGGAMAAIRLSRDHQGRGLGGATLTALISLARVIGLKTLTARVMVENTPSMRMTSRHMPHVKTESGIAHFALAL